MNKKFFSMMIMFALISYSSMQAGFSYRNLLQATQQKIASTNSYLVNNAWRIAGTASFATAAISTATIIKATLEDARFTKSLSSILPQNVARLLFPLGCSIFGLLCFNVHQQMQKNISLDDLLTILNNIQEYNEESVKIQARSYIDDVHSQARIVNDQVSELIVELGSLHNN